MNDDILAQFSYNPITGSLYRKGKLCKARHSRGYLVVSVGSKNERKVYFQHRLLWKLTTGTWPEHTIDHINRVKDDNRFVNLRDVPQGINNQNQPVHANTRFQISGIHFCSTRNRFICRMNLRGELLYLGAYTSLFEACCARKSADNKYAMLR